MPINQSIWRIGRKIEHIKETLFSAEANLEEILQYNPDILDSNWLVIGRQVKTKFNKYIDLLAIDNTGSIIVIELKKDKTPRDVVAQGLDYASWIKDLQSDEISKIFDIYSDKYLKDDLSLNDAYYKKFKTKLEEDNLNSSHQIVIVTPDLDSSTERIVNYLSSSEIPINVAFFKVFEDNGKKYISRAWMIDPFEISDIASVPKTKEPWNGEFYVSFGHGKNRNWDDAKDLGFISAGGGIWYNRTLNKLSLDDRVWVNIPQKGYVGVGKVTDTAKKADEVIFSKNGKERNIYELSDKANYFAEFKDDEDNAEYIVKINWLKTVAKKNAVSEVGFFGNQNTVCKPTSPKWTYTINRLKEVWKIT